MNKIAHIQTAEMIYVTFGFRGFFIVFIIAFVVVIVLLVVSIVFVSIIIDFLTSAFLTLVLRFSSSPDIPEVVPVLSSLCGPLQAKFYFILFLHKWSQAQRECKILVYEERGKKESV